ncbi:hypothetical protein HF520_04895 [Romboutsia sp. CE17]|uniref:hypothetical protein n=1 Tax=Romboutsia sp. CE17 TaxID=2724150 RepID=UPI001442CDAD|nr:hypothetical protein [Romboutsia sp. CE17]QJA08325.1 hypothetical protein HF520_04895 [Romboutsia sp. CE17]
MNKNFKDEVNNQWAGSNISLMSRTESKEKDENNNEWTSTLKKSPKVYGRNCHPEKHNNK